MAWSVRAASQIAAVALVLAAANTAATDSPGIAQLTRAALQDEPNANALCSRGSETALLFGDGTVAVQRRGCGTDRSIPLFLADVQRIEGSGLGQAPRTFAVKGDGTLVAWGDARCGLLGNDELARNYHATAVAIGLRGVTSLASGSWFTVARTHDGGVYSWGLNYEGSLGLCDGDEARGSVRCDNEYYPVGHRYRVGAAVTRPTQLLLADIVAVAADRVTGYALGRAGDVYEWGLIPVHPDPQPFGTFDTQPVPRKVAGLPPAIAIVVSHYMKFALAADGTVHGWGPNVVGNFGDGTSSPRLVPARVPNLENVIEIAASGDSPIVALLADGTIRQWGGCCYLPDSPIPPWIATVPTMPVAGATPFHSDERGYYSGTLPPIHRVAASGGVVLLYGVDGSLYQFPKSYSEPVFVLVSTDAARTTPRKTTVAIEYHHAAFDHYFVTASADEIAKLDAGTLPGWRRTGLAFGTYAPADGAGGVCRLFSTAFGAKSSHFYTLDPLECTAAKSDRSWSFEGIVFGMSLPDAAGRCPPFSTPVYRLYNDGRGGAPNHRYTKATSVRGAMIARGWVPEGRGPTGVAMCAPD